MVGAQTINNQLKARTVPAMETATTATTMTMETKGTTVVALSGNSTGAAASLARARR
jgi:hypothetical protein